MRFLITGATGFIGRHLWPALRDKGHEVIVLARDQKRAERSLQGIRVWQWNGTIGLPPAGAFEGVDAVVNLIGESVAKRWNAERKRRARDSRVLPTRALIERIETLATRPKIMVSMAGTHYYGDRGDEVLTEAAGPGRGFLAKVSKEWEEAALGAETLGVRTVVLRSGAILGRDGGLLQRILLPFRLGLGGRLGSGRQYFPWIHIDDLVGLIAHVVARESARGPINSVAPEPVTNAEFTRALGRMLGRPTRLAIPAFVLKMIFGEMAEELLLASQRVSPIRALDEAYVFTHPLLEPALANLLHAKAA